MRYTIATHYFCIVGIVTTEIRDRIGYIQPDLPEKRNALGPDMVRELKEAVRNFLRDDAVKIIVFRSDGPAFCSGADLEYLSRIREFTHEENLADSNNLRELFDLIHKGDKIFISEVNGPALAGGCGLATICDFCFASPEATFGYTEARIGFIPALVMVYLQQRISGHDLREMLLTARIMKAEEAWHKGLVNGIVPATELPQYVSEFAKNLATTVSGNSVSMIKEMLRSIHAMGFDEALALAAENNAKARKSADCIRGIDAFLNKEKISW